MDNKASGSTSTMFLSHSIYFYWRSWVHTFKIAASCWLTCAWCLNSTCNNEAKTSRRTSRAKGTSRRAAISKGERKRRATLVFKATTLVLRHFSSVLSRVRNTRFKMCAGIKFILRSRGISPLKWTKRRKQKHEYFTNSEIFYLRPSSSLKKKKNLVPDICCH